MSSSQFPLFSKNGEILPIEQAVIPLNNIEYSYGYGVYESLKVRNGTLYFVTEHVERLQQSAKIIGIVHTFKSKEIEQFIKDLVAKTPVESFNIKVLLIGGKEPQLYIQALAPLFPDRKLYAHGAKTITIEYERPYPNAKTLNMLPSYLAYRKAKEAGAYDALLINKTGHIIEGTRTNFFTIKDSILYTAPVSEVLEGVTRQTVIAVAKKNGLKLEEKDIPLSKLQAYDGAFLTSTSTKIMPIREIDGFTWPNIPEKVKDLINQYDTFLEESKGTSEKLRI